MDGDYLLGAGWVDYPLDLVLGSAYLLEDVGVLVGESDEAFPQRLVCSFLEESLWFEFLADDGIYVGEVGGVHRGGIQSRNYYNTHLER